MNLAADTPELSKPSDDAIVVRDVTCTFMIGAGLMKPKRPLHAVNNVNLTVPAGKVTAIVGESGCGKTTLAKIMLGLIKPTSGEIMLDGQPIAGRSRLDIGSFVQPIFQDPYSSLNPRKSIGDIVSLPLRVHGTHDRATLSKRVAEMMDLVGLPKRVTNNFPSQLSGGQRQRVAIARALINKPRIVICDEPTSALDVSVQSQILNLLMDLKAEFGLSYVVISHNLAVVEHIADRVAVMYLGRIVEAAETEEIFSAARHPYTQALLSSVLTPDPSLGIPDAHLGAAYPDPVNPPPGCTFHPRCPSVMPHCRDVPPRMIETDAGLVRCHLFDEASGVSAASSASE